MKKVKYYILLVSLLVLTGCSERVLTIDRVYPDTSSLDEAREKRQLELGIEKEVDNLVSTLKKEGKRPRSLELDSPTDTMSYSAHVTQYCQANKLEECESMQPIHPNDNSAPNFKLYYLRVAANEKIPIGFSTSASAIVPFPSRVEAYIYEENKNLHLHETIDRPGIISEVTSPSNLGSYVFQFKAYYEGEVEGISYHPHGITVVAPE